MSLKQTLVAIDQLINAIFGGYADETLSSRAWRLRDKQPWLYKSIDAVFFWDINHCYQSYYSEKVRRQMPPELR
jgi:hypothetical protein